MVKFWHFHILKLLLFQYLVGTLKISHGLTCPPPPPTSMPVRMCVKSACLSLIHIYNLPAYNKEKHLEKESYRFVDLWKYEK